MKNILSIIALVLFSQYVEANISLSGNYQGKDLYIQNPMGQDGFGFCVTNVTVNGNPVTDGIESSAFEINFSNQGIKKGAKVEVVIEHGDGCKPKVLNPEVLLPQSTFKIEEMSCSQDGLLKWTTTSEQGKLPFIVEQFRWNKWVRVGEVNGEGSPGKHSYEFKIEPHSGKNQIRVSQVDHTGKKRPSDPVTFTSDKPVVSMKPKKVNKKIYFEVEGQPIKTRYEIFDAYGNVVKKGYSDEVTCDNLKKGAYYLNYDNNNMKFLKK